MSWKWPSLRPAARAIAAGWMITGLALASGTNAAEPSESEILDAVFRQLRDVVPPRIAHEGLIVLDTLLVTQQMLLAKKIILYPGARIIFQTPSENAEGYLIIAQMIVSLDPERPGVLTWEPLVRSPPPLPNHVAPPASRGADRGKLANSELVARPGGNGAAGQAGSRGTPGSNAPRLVLLASTIQGGLLIDFRGQVGTAGGAGQTGGAGGRGGYGALPIDGITACLVPAAQSGDGGQGGPGGVGGTGGDGGKGGSIVLIAPTERISPSVPVVLVAGGASGPGGGLGLGGLGGKPGRAAEGIGTCSGGAVGREGEKGRDADPGPPGQVGESGWALVVTDPPVDRFDLIFNRIWPIAPRITGATKATKRRLCPQTATCQPAAPR